MMNPAGDTAQALMVVRDVMEWSLTPDRWAAVDKSVAALTVALAVADDTAMRDAVTTLELLGPVRGRAAEFLASPERPPDGVRERLESVVRILLDLQAPAPVGLWSFPVTIFLSDDAIHDQVERAVDVLVDSAGLVFASRQPPVTGSWFRRMRAVLRSPAGEEVLVTAAHVADSRFVLRPDAEVTAMLLQNLAPVITALQPAKDAAVRVGALLIVKVNWTVVVHQLTPRQQLVLDHSPGLESAPHQILHALGLPAAEPGSPLP